MKEEPKVEQPTGEAAEEKKEEPVEAQSEQVVLKANTPEEESKQIDEPLAETEKKEEG